MAGNDQTVKANLTPQSQTITVDMLAEALAKSRESQSSDVVDLARELQRQNNRQVLPSNARSSGKSPFSYPEGDHDRPKPTFDRQVYLNGHKEDLQQLTPFEIDTYNRLSKSLPTPEHKRTSRDGKFSARISADNKEMYLTLPCKSLDEQAAVPASLALFLRELMDGTVVNPTDMLADLDEAKARIAALEAQLHAKDQPVGAR